MRCAYRYWCEGSEEKAVQLMVSLIKRFGLHDALRNELYAEHVNTDAYIVDRFRQGRAARAEPCVCCFLCRVT